MNPPENKRGSRLCFPEDSEAGLAYRIALGDMGGLPIDCVSPRLLRLVADAREGKIEPSSTCANIVEAWYAASLRYGSTARKMNIGRLKEGPTLFEVKREFIRLFVSNAKWPKDWSRKAVNQLKDNKVPKRQTFEEMFKRLKLPVRRDSAGRPRKPQPN